MSEQMNGAAEAVEHPDSAADREKAVVAAWVEADLAEQVLREAARELRAKVEQATAATTAALGVVSDIVQVPAGKARTFLVVIDGETHVVRCTKKGPSRVERVE